MEINLSTVGGMVLWAGAGGGLAYLIWSFIETRRRGLAVQATAAANPDMTEVEKEKIRQQPLPSHWDSVAMFAALAAIAGSVVMHTLDIGFSDSLALIVGAIIVLGVPLVFVFPFIERRYMAELKKQAVLNSAEMKDRLARSRKKQVQTNPPRDPEGQQRKGGGDF
jgi:hypothetical protein